MEGNGLVGVDVGGTFTDCVAFDKGTIRALKVRTRPLEEHLSVLEGAQRLGIDGASMFNHASTAGLNAVITRRLPKIGYLATEGHRDVPDMGRAWRPFEALTDAGWRRPFSDAGGRPLVPRYLRRGVRERITEDGGVLISLDAEQARRHLEVLAKCDIQGVAICLLNSYVNSEHEIALRELVKEVLGDSIPCSISSEVSPLAKEYQRASTTLIDVLMKGIYGEYAGRLVDGLGGIGFEGVANFADCAATLIPVDVALERPHRIVFSGPAAGTMSASYFGELIGEPNLICADVGGTSTDFGLVTGASPRVGTTLELEHDLLVNTLANEIVTLGAGGGSIVSVTSGGDLAVGPESAGGDPGPASYGRGGEMPTMTDACLMIGILSPGDFLGGEMRLDRRLAEAAFEGLDTPIPGEERVRHAYEIGLNHLSEAIIDLSVRYGIDPRDFSILAYGSAGPMLLPAVLATSAAKSVIVPPYPGLFSALGLMSTDRVHTESRSAYMPLASPSAERVDAIYREMESTLLTQAKVTRDEVRIVRSLDGRLIGQTWDTPFVPVPPGEISEATIEQIVGVFHDTYEERWGSRFEEMPVEGVTYRVQLFVPTEKVNYATIDSTDPDTKPEPSGRVTLRHIVEGEVEALEYRREDLKAGHVVEGPAIIREDMSTTQVCVGQRAIVGPYGEIVISMADKETNQ